MVSACKETGSGHLLWPPHVDSVQSLPSQLVFAVDHALMILNWHENCLKKDIPPSWMWPLEWELEEWWIGVDYRRNHPDAHDNDDVDLSDREENEYADRFK